MRIDCDILIAGGGISGLLSAVAFGQAGYNVICIDPNPPINNLDSNHVDLRTTAILQPAQKFLARIGIWDYLSPHATPLQSLRIMDVDHGETSPRLVREFDSTEISEEPFGWNLQNSKIIQTLSLFLEKLNHVECWYGKAAVSLLTRQAEAHVGLDDGTFIRTRLLLACDGRSSRMRQAAGISVRTRHYGQKALAFVVSHPIPHNYTSTEIYQSGGPFTLVPMADIDNAPTSAVVWMETGRKANDLLSLPETEFDEAITLRSCHQFGPLKLISRRSVWPIISQFATRLSGERIALLAEAAHVVPPIGAQGLNMSLADIFTLLDLVKKNPMDVGDRSILDAYQNKRTKDIRLRVGGIDLLNRFSMSIAQPLRDVRAAGLSFIHNIRPVRQAVMRAMLGAK
ncbi:MAG: FAD-dependent monooxygenase [Aestuariivita sp.]|nr:FAD-dependent monooxygenase [Aestuariivita sp.]